VLVAAGALDRLAAAAERTCAKSGYSYAGVQDTRAAHGVRATLVPISQPQVGDGHLAAWIGVGGLGLGPRGTDEWIQVGLSTFADDTIRVYLEVVRPATGLRYTELAVGVATGARVAVAVVELAARPGWWQVVVDGQPRSDPVRLPGSSGSWEPIATVEAWRSGNGSCARFAYRFEEVEVLLAPGGRWAGLSPGHVFEDPGYRVAMLGDETFLVRSDEATVQRVPLGRKPGRR